MSTADKVRRRGFWKVLLIVLAVGCVTSAGIIWYATTDSFQNMVRRRMVAELERATGGRVELGSFHTSPFRLRMEIRDVTIHGKESSGEIPYIHVDRMIAEAKIVSVLGLELGFHSLVLDHPTVHVIASSSGQTNIPEPKISASKPSALQRLFAISIGRLEVRHGTLFWNDQKTPLDFTARDVSVDMSYSLLYRRYEGNLLIGKADTRFQDFRPFAWMAQAHFLLSSRYIEFQFLTLRSGRSHLEASGRLDNFEKPRLQLIWDSSMDLAEAAAITRQPGIRSGTLVAGGRGEWAGDKFLVTGKAAVKDFSGRQEDVSFNEVDLSSTFNFDQEHLTISGIEGRLLGGTVGGEAEVTNWLPEKSVLAGKKARTPEQEGKLRLKWKGVSISGLSGLLQGQFRNLQKMNFAGASTGSLDAHWTGTFRRSEAALVVDIVPQKRILPGQLPLNAHLRGTYRGASDQLQLTQFDASTPASQIHASGTLASNAALKFNVTTTNLSELQPILAILNYPVVPAVLHGPASFTGTASGDLSNISLAGTIHAQNFDLLPADTKITQPIEVDAFNAQVHLTPHNLSIHNATLRRGDMAVNFDAGAVLRDRTLSPLSPFTLHMDMQHVSAAELLAVTGYEYPVTGTLNLRLRASGTKQQPHGEGHIELSHGVVRGQPVQLMSADLHFLNSEVALTNMHLVSDQAKLAGNARYNFSTHAFLVDLNGENLDLRRIPAFQSSRLAMNGQANFVLHGSGTLEKPVLQAHVQLLDFSINQHPLGVFVVDATTQGGDLKLTGRSQFKRATLAMNGDVRMQGDMPANIDFTFTGMDLDPFFAGYLKKRAALYSEADGGVHLQGPLRDLQKVRLTGNLTTFSLAVDKFKVQNRGSVQFSLADSALRLDQLHLTGAGTDFSATGSIQLGGDYKVQLRAQGSANLRLIQVFNSDFTSSGRVTADVTASGPIAQPTVEGRIAVEHGSVAYIDLPSALSDINGTLVFNQRQLQIQSLSAQVGGGNVNFTGYANLDQGRLHFDLGMQGHDVRLRYPPGVSSTADLNLHYAGTTNQSLLSGDIIISKLAITPGFDFASYLAASGQPNPLPQTNPLLNRIHMDVHVTTTPELQMQTAAVRLSGDADLHLRGTAARPALLGRADILEGEIYFNGTKYRLERGDVIFVNPATIQPVVDLQATTQVRDYDITLDVNGQAGKPLNITYRSEPPLPPTDIIALLALGRTQEQSAQLQGQTPLTQEASNAILAEALNAAVSNRVQKLFGGSRVKIDPQGLSTETSIARGPAITIEQQVAGNITLTFSTNISQTSQQVIQGEYNISRNVSIVAVRDQNGVVSFDVRIRHRKK